MLGNIAIIDYGFGNLHSVEKAMRFIGAETSIINRAGDLKHFSGAILPGVGAFGDAVASLQRSCFDEALKDYARSGKPLLGICLGMQLLFSCSEEFGSHEGLDLIRGRVVRFPKKETGKGLSYKIPHVGWNRLLKSPDGSRWDDTIMKGIEEGTEAYFVHSFVALPEDKSNVLSYSEYGDFLFTSAVKKGNMYGCQFHPEKSRDAGINMLRNFVNKVNTRL